MPASTQLHALQTLLRKQGLGSALRPIAAKRYPPAATGFAELDALLGGGIPCGQITELVGKASSGCTSVALSLLAEATARQEIAAYIDASDCFDPPSAERAGVALDRLLWVRCGDKKAPGVRGRVSGETGGTGILGCPPPSRDGKGSGPADWRRYPPRRHGMPHPCNRKIAHFAPRVDRSTLQPINGLRFTLHGSRAASLAGRQPGGRGRRVRPNRP